MSPRGSAVPIVSHHRRYAEQCLNLAEEEENGGPRLAVFLEMAVTWVKFAQKVNVETLEKPSTRVGGLINDQMDYRSGTFRAND
jgi:hypothetical protein